jgi:hypothetical protein
MLYLLYFAPGVILGIALTRLFPHIFFRFLFQLPGTILHELTHFVTAWLSNAKPTGFSIFPHKLADGSWQLGSVTCTNIRWYNGAIVGLAPLSIFAIFYFFIPPSIGTNFQSFIWWALIAFFAQSAFPSKPDLKIAARSTIPILLILGGSYLFLHF